MKSWFALGSLLAALLVLPAGSASAAERDLDCATDEWQITTVRGQIVAITITNDCNDVVAVFFRDKKGNEIQVDVVPPNQTETVSLRLKPGERIRCEGNGTGSWTKTVEFP